MVSLSEQSVMQHRKQTDLSSFTEDFTFTVGSPKMSRVLQWGKRERTFQVEDPGKWRHGDVAVLCKSRSRKESGIPGPCNVWTNWRGAGSEAGEKFTEPDGAGLWTLLRSLASVLKALRRHGRALSRGDDIIFYRRKITGSRVEVGRLKAGRLLQ